jgi:hypothetical protein
MLVLMPQWCQSVEQSQQSLALTRDDSSGDQSVGNIATNKGVRKIRREIMDPTVRER